MIVQNLMARGFADAARGVATDVFEGFVLGAKYSLSGYGRRRARRRGRSAW